ncbi:MAG: Cupin 2, conserved barrel domain protein, partial [Acidobacteria bacterium]|nr:Cupin 2, conserved barrel domain protein [Acidobacteriota bacterium]
MKAQSWQELEWEVVTKDLSRKIVTGKNVMVAQIRLAKGALVPEHSHPNEQISQIL